MFNFVEIYRSVVYPLTVSQNFISMSCFVEKLMRKNLGGFTPTPPPPPPGGGRLRSDTRVSVNYSRTQRIIAISNGFSFPFDLICLYKQRCSWVRPCHKISENWSTDQRIPAMVYRVSQNKKLKIMKDVWQAVKQYSDTFNFLNFVCFWLLTPRLRFWYINTPFSFTISLNIKSWIRNSFAIHDDVENTSIPV